MEVAKYLKTIETGEDPNDFEDLLQKQAALSRNSHDWKIEGCGICKYPRTEHQRYVVKRRLCTFFCPFFGLGAFPIGPGCWHTFIMRSL